ADKPLRLLGRTPEDIPVISALLQDAVFPASEMAWQPSKRRFAILLNRFRWEDAPKARKRGRAFERVQSLLAVEDVLKVSSMGIDRTDKEQILSPLALEWQAGDDGAGILTLVLAGDGAISLHVEAIEVSLRDVTRPYVAAAKDAPHHPE
ncbi:MAG: DUF2948 family protein, partial [Nereida ignava]